MGAKSWKTGQCIVIALVGLASLAPPAFAAGPQTEMERSLKRASFAKEHASGDVRQIADWIVDSADNQAMPFVIIDKPNAKVFVFHADGRVRGAAPVLLGLSRGDDSAPGFGDRDMKDIPPQDRTTPAGRFVAAVGKNYHGVDVVWVDYAAAISMHRVVKGTPAERRAQRLASPTSDDNRISYGCINVPVKFFDSVIIPSFKGTNGIVYVMPETRPARTVFGSYDVEERAQRRLAASTRPPAAGAVAVSANN